jgi:hypothetical protein
MNLLFYNTFSFLHEVMLKNPTIVLSDYHFLNLHILSYYYTSIDVNDANNNLH